MRGVSRLRIVIREGVTSQNSLGFLHTPVLAYTITPSSIVKQAEAAENHLKPWANLVEDAGSESPLKSQVFAANKGINNLNNCQNAIMPIQSLPQPKWSLPIFPRRLTIFYPLLPSLICSYLQWSLSTSHRRFCCHPSHCLCFGWRCCDPAPLKSVGVLPLFTMRALHAKRQRTGHGSESEEFPLF